MNVWRPLLVTWRIFFFVRAVIGLSAVSSFKHKTGNKPFYYILLVLVELTKMPKDFSIDLWYLFQFFNLKLLPGPKTTWQPWETEKERTRQPKRVSAWLSFCSRVFLFYTFSSPSVFVDGTFSVSVTFTFLSVAVASSRRRAKTRLFPSWVF